MSKEDLIPVKKGEVRNPRGRGKGVPNTKTRMLKLFKLVVTKKNPINGKDELFTGAELLDMALFAKAMKGDVPAYREIMDRVEGKITQPIELPPSPPSMIQLIRVDRSSADVSTSEQEIKDREGL